METTTAFRVSSSGANSKKNLMTPRGSVAGSNRQFQGSAEQQRCSVPVMLRMPAPPELQRWAPRDVIRMQSVSRHALPCVGGKSRNPA